MAIQLIMISSFEQLNANEYTCSQSNYAIKIVMAVAVCVRVCSTTRKPASIFDKVYSFRLHTLSQIYNRSQSPTTETETG